jgi:type I restriction enzyme R subunit
MSEDELALFDFLPKEHMTTTQRERVKLDSRSLLASIEELIAPLERWTDKEQAQAEVEVRVLDHLFDALSTPPFTDEDKQLVAKRVYQHIWQQSAAGAAGAPFAA